MMRQKPNNQRPRVPPQREPVYEDPAFHMVSEHQLASSAWSELLLGSYKFLKITQRGLDSRYEFVEDLNKTLQLSRPFGDEEQCEFKVFGSCANGLANAHSDLDITLVFTDTSEEEDRTTRFNALIRFLRNQCAPILRIDTVVRAARVPVVRYACKRNADICGEISIDGFFGLENSQLIKTYSKIDPRFPQLACAVKTFAKYLGIGDAAMSYLSSYAYVMLVIYFLQRTHPPVLPCLQKMAKPDENAVKMIGKFNFWFQDDLQHISKTFHNKNTQSLGELWLDFLSFYADQDFGFVVRVSDLKFEKNPRKNAITIWDPFIDHNLSRGRSGRILRRIKQSFQVANYMYRHEMYVHPNLDKFPDKIKHEVFEQKLYESWWQLDTLAHAEEARRKERKNRKKFQKKQKVDTVPAVNCAKPEGETTQASSGDK